MVTALAGTVELPKMVKVRQKLDHTNIPRAEIPAKVRQELLDCAFLNLVKISFNRHIRLFRIKATVCNVSNTLKMRTRFSKSSGCAFCHWSLFKCIRHSAACQASPIHARCRPSWPVLPITSRKSSRSAFFR